MPPSKAAKAASSQPTSRSPKRRASFKLTAPEATVVCVAGSFNDWDPTARPLKRSPDGVFRTWMNLPAGTYEYRFVVDGEWCEDPACTDRVPNPHGGHNSVITLSRRPARSVSQT